MLYRKWILKETDAQKSQVLAKSLGISRLLSDVLVTRGMETPEEAQRLLNDSQPLPDPYRLKDMDKAVDRIRRAVEEDEPMVIFGDYDVDGITATALLYTYLESLGADVYYKLPNRHNDDYGLSPAHVEQIASRGIKLIITVDNGTSALEAVEAAKQCGIDIVMTDHHLPLEQLPQVTALVNPCRGDDTSGCGNLSGVGVAFMLVAAMEECPPDELLPMFGELVAIGTVADVMSLTGDNRTMVKAGLAVLQDTTRPGLAALIESCGWKDKTVTIENISYGIAPRLNAAGRMDDATEALRLLLADSPEEAGPLVQNLLDQNVARQKAEQDIVATINTQVEQDPELQQSRVLVVSGENWHSGVVGIVASRLVDKYAKPAIVISFDGDEGRGSGRSLAGFSLHGAIASCEDILIRYGGHDLAAGLSIRREHLPEFRRRVNAWAKEKYPVPVTPTLSIDAKMALTNLSVSMVQDLEKLSPCGSGNPNPRFLLADAVVDAVYPVIDGKHSRLRLRQNGNSLFAMCFGKSPERLPYREGDVVDVLLTLSIYEGKYEPQISARVVDIRPAGLSDEHVRQSALFESFSTGGDIGEDQRVHLAPSRKIITDVYRLIRDEGIAKFNDLRPVFSRLGEENTGRVLTALAALEELGLIVRDTESGSYQVQQVSGKKDLAASLLLQRLEV